MLATGATLTLIVSLILSTSKRRFMDDTPLSIASQAMTARIAQFPGNFIRSSATNRHGVAISGLAGGTLCMSPTVMTSTPTTSTSYTSV